MKNSHEGILPIGESYNQDVGQEANSSTGNNIGAKWNSSQGGNVLEWLGARTAVSLNKSKGALEYIKSRVEQTEAQEQAKTTSNNNDLIAHLAKLFPDKTEVSAPTSSLSPPVPQHPTPSTRPKMTCAAIGTTQQMTIPVPLSQLPPEEQANVARNVEKRQRRRQELTLPTDPEEREKWENAIKSMQELRAQLNEQYSNQERVRVDEIHENEKLDIPVILKLIEEHQVTFICTDTGSGKSTGVPKALLELNENTRVVSTQPRRTATIAIAERVSSLRQSSVGQDVGYWIRGAKCGDEQTRLWYMTSYTLLLNLLTCPLDPPYTHIVLDEFHERQPDIEVTVSLLRLLLLNKKGNFKLIIMSATLNTEDWELYFSGLTVATFKQKEPDYPIHDYFMEDVANLTGVRYVPSMGFNPAIVDHHIIDQSMLMAQQIIMFLNSGCNAKHSILVFMPGRAQVEQLQTWLQHHAPFVEPIPWHSAVELHVIEMAFKQRYQNRQKVYIATDIAECSITLPDVVFVIDTALVKRPLITKSLPATIMYPPLSHQWISKGSVSQRRGRVGRVQQGFYFCLVSRRHIMLLIDYNVPLIENSRIDELSLHVLQLVSNPVAIYGICHGQPLVETITHTMNSLQQLGCILSKEDPMAHREGVEEVYSNAAWSPLIMKEAQNIVGDMRVEEYVVTFIGRLLQLIPISAQQGMLIFYGFLTGLESLTIVAAAVTSSIFPFTINPKDDAAAHRGNRGKRHRIKVESITKAMETTEDIMKKMARELRSDVVAVTGAVLQFRALMSEGVGTEALRNWCIENQLSYERMTAIVDLENHIKYELSAFVPFRDVDEPKALLTQFEKIAPVLLVMINAAFASQALEVTSEGNVYLHAKEGAIGLFTNLSAVPDVHTPSCLRWERDDVVVPITISLHYTKMIVGFATATKSRTQFWISTMLFAYRIEYEIVADDYYVFKITFSGRSHYVKVNKAIVISILQFRAHCSDICAMLRLRYSHKDMIEDEFTDIVLREKGYNAFVTTQRNVLRCLQPLFGADMDSIIVEELQTPPEKFSNVVLFSFAIKDQL